MSPFKTRPYIVAEVGSNWGSLDDCLRSIEVAKECGADAAKFQGFTWEALYGEPAPGVWQKRGPGPTELPIQWLPRLKEKADAVGIDFACTAFSPELVKAVDPYVKWHKVASSDAAWPQMLEAVKATGKPILISTGGKTPEDVERASKIIGVDVDALWLYCVAAYPADYVDFAMMGFHDGFSDHSLGYTAAVAAGHGGAFVIEKHFTAFPELDTPDRPHSLTPPQFRAMVDLIREGKRPDQEGAMRLRHNRRLIAIRDVANGEMLKYGVNYGAYRSLVDDTRGASPLDWLRVEGSATRREIKRGEAIALEDVR